MSRRLLPPCAGCWKTPAAEAAAPLTAVVYWLYYCQGGENGKRNAATKNKAGAGAVHAGAHRHYHAGLGDPVLRHPQHSPAHRHHRGRHHRAGAAHQPLAGGAGLDCLAPAGCSQLRAGVQVSGVGLSALGGHCQRQSGRVLPPLGVSAPDAARPDALSAGGGAAGRRICRHRRRADRAAGRLQRR